MTSDRKQQIERLVDQYEQLTKRSGSEEKLPLGDVCVLAKAIAQELRADDAMDGLARNQARVEQRQHLMKLAQATDAPGLQAIGRAELERMDAAFQLAEALRIVRGEDGVHRANGDAAAKNQPPRQEPSARGRKPKYPWERCKSDILKLLDDLGAPARQTELEDDIRAWMEQRGHQPGHTQVRKYASAWLNEFKKSRAGN